MRISDLESNLENYKFNQFLNEVASYVMYEQAIIKKDNNVGGSSIKYRYDKKSFKIINFLISSIEFLSEPVIGSAKKVVVKDLPDDYKYSVKHELSIKDKIYILDKIKDSFMHLHNNETMYDIDDDNIVIKNIDSDYSLECKISFKALYVFNRGIKYFYDTSMPSLNWIDKFFMRDRKINLSKKLLVKGLDANFNLINLSPRRRVIYIPDTDCYYFFEESGFDDYGFSTHQMSKQEYDSYHTDSYVSLLKASSDDMNYPLLESLYDFDFHCDHSAYVDKLEKIMKSIMEFYNVTYSNIGKIDQNKLKKNILDFLFSVGQNGKDKGLISDISSINNMIIKKYMRNARSHANNRGVENCRLGEEKIIYHDVLYNSLQNEISDKSVPTFVLIGGRKDLNSFFEKIRNHSMSNRNLYEQIVNDLYLGKDDSLELFLQQFTKFINQCSKDNILYAESLKMPVGNANDFVDFIRKIMNGTFEFEDVKEIKKAM